MEEMTQRILVCDNDDTRAAEWSATIRGLVGDLAVVETLSGQDLGQEFGTLRSAVAGLRTGAGDYEGRFNSVDVVIADYDLSPSDENDIHLF